jgi:hypothetical protein
MWRFLETLRALRHNWGVGFATLLVMLAGLAVFGLIAAAVIVVLAAGFGLSDAQAWDWWLVSSILWAPLAVGTLMPSIRRWERIGEKRQTSLYG